MRPRTPRPAPVVVVPGPVPESSPAMDWPRLPVPDPLPESSPAMGAAEVRASGRPRAVSRRLLAALIRAEHTTEEIAALVEYSTSGLLKVLYEYGAAPRYADQPRGTEPRPHVGRLEDPEADVAPSEFPCPKCGRPLKRQGAQHHLGPCCGWADAVELAPSVEVVQALPAPAPPRPAPAATSEELYAALLVRLARLVEDECDIDEIAQRSGLSVRQVRTILARHGARPRWPSQPRGTWPPPVVGQLRGGPETERAPERMVCESCEEEIRTVSAERHFGGCLWGVEAPADGGRIVLPSNRPPRTRAGRALAVLFAAGWTAAVLLEHTTLTKGRLDDLVAERGKAATVAEAERLEQLLELALPWAPERGPARDLVRAGRRR